MDFSNSIIFLLLHFFVLYSLVNHVYSSKTGYGQLVNQTSRQEKYFQKLRKTKGIFLQEINKHALKTIHSRDGDIIDCVMIHKQPAFDHPLLKGHKLLDPPEIPKEHNPEIPQEYNETNILNKIIQLWSASGESCPDKTIPILRNRKDGIMSKNSSYNIFKNETISNSDTAKHEYAIVKVEGGEHYGGSAIFNVWDPYVVHNEFSLSQMWVAFNSPTGPQPNMNSVEVGWQIYPKMNGDSLPKIFVYWTADTYKTTGCYNLKCPGFVQISKKIVLGGTLAKISKYNGKQFVFTAIVWRDPKTKNWWLRIGSDTVGYWPTSLFPFLKDHANIVHFGGEIVDDGPSWSHTYTQMGSGHFSNEGFRKAAYVRKLQTVDSENYLTSLVNPVYEAKYPNCYDLKSGSSKSWGDYFYFGGPGQNNNCIRGNN